MRALRGRGPCWNPAAAMRPIDRVEVVDERSETLGTSDPGVGTTRSRSATETRLKRPTRPVWTGAVYAIHVARRAECVRQQPVDARVAAEHPVQRHHVVRRERLDRAVADGEGAPVGEPSLGRECSRLRDRTAGEVDPGGVRGAALERREREIAGAASDVEHRSRLEALTTRALRACGRVIGAPTSPLASPRGTVRPPIRRSSRPSGRARPRSIAGSSASPLRSATGGNAERKSLVGGSSRLPS